ncbi:hypothetical protein ABTH37_18710, partial [Acinetobacter baumannii]
HFQCPSSLSDSTGSVVDSTQRDSIKCDLKSLVELADQLPGLHIDILKHESALVTPGVTKQAHYTLNMESSCIGWNEKCADASSLSRGFLD